MLPHSSTNTSRSVGVLCVAVYVATHHQHPDPSAAVGALQQKVLIWMNYLRHCQPFSFLSAFCTVTLQWIPGISRDTTEFFWRQSHNNSSERSPPPLRCHICQWQVKLELQHTPAERLDLSSVWTWSGFRSRVHESVRAGSVYPQPYGVCPDT